MRGANVSGLPAAVREINESYSYDKDTPDFFLVTHQDFCSHTSAQALGAKHDYELVKKGNEYHCVHAGHALRVNQVLHHPLLLQQVAVTGNCFSLIALRLLVSQDRVIEKACTTASCLPQVQLLRVTPVPPRTQNPDAVQMASEYFTALGGPKL
eukprot:1159352-Pelagomonas_calceolata.AAC.6